MTTWDYILLGALAFGIILTSIKKSRALGAVISLITPIFMVFYFAIVGRFEVVFYVLIFMAIYTIIPYVVVKNQKEESK